MKKNLAFLLSIFCSSAFAQSLPFSLNIEQISAPDLPAIHSFARAQWGNHWLIVAGRVDGLHNLFPNLAFSETEQNDHIFVIDTSTWEVTEGSLNSLSYDQRAALSAVNTEYFQRDHFLYVMGGYGYDSLNDVKKTFSTLTALDVEGLIDEITSGGNNLSPYIRQITDTVFTVTGGKIESIGSKFYLAGGQNFYGSYTKTDQGLYTQQYTNSISNFELLDDGVNLSLNNFSQFIDTVNFHRRDLNSAPMISIAGEEGFGVYGGVFQYEHDLPYQNPVYITSSGTSVDFNFQQKMSQYNCPVIPLYDSVNEDMFTLFFAGISLYYYDSVNQSLKEDTMVPFIKDISSMIVHSDGTTEEIILPVKFPERGEANAEFFVNAGLPRYENGVIKLHELSSPVLLGYIYGGIVSAAGNDGATYASNKLYRIVLLPAPASSVNESGSAEQLRVYPNPASGVVWISAGGSFKEVKEIKISDAMNRVVWKNDGPNQVNLHEGLRIGTENLSPGIYTIELRNNLKKYITKLVIVR